MHTRRALFAVALAALLVGPAGLPAPVPKEIRRGNPDDAILQGRWEQVIPFGEHGWAKPPGGSEIRFAKGKAVFAPSGVEGTYPEYEYKLDLVAGTKVLDVTQPDGTVCPGIYEIDGDILTLCRGKRNKDRPTDYANGPDQWCETYQRVRK